MDSMILEGFSSPNKRVFSILWWCCRGVGTLLLGSSWISQPCPRFLGITWCFPCPVPIFQSTPGAACVGLCLTGHSQAPGAEFTVFTNCQQCCWLSWRFGPFCRFPAPKVMAAFPNHCIELTAVGGHFPFGFRKGFWAKIKEFLCSPLNLVPLMLRGSQSSWMPEKQTQKAGSDA